MKTHRHEITCVKTKLNLQQTQETQLGAAKCNQVQQTTAAAGRPQCRSNQRQINRAESVQPLPSMRITLEYIDTLTATSSAIKSHIRTWDIESMCYDTSKIKGAPPKAK